METTAAIPAAETKEQDMKSPYCRQEVANQAAHTPVCPCCASPPTRATT